MERFTRRPPIEHLPWPTVHEVLDVFDLVTRPRGEVHALEEELPEQPIRVLIRCPLPGTLRMRKVDGDAGRLCEEPTLGHLLPPVVRQRARQIRMAILTTTMTVGQAQRPIVAKLRRGAMRGSNLYRCP